MSQLVSRLAAEFTVMACDQRAAFAHRQLRSRRFLGSRSCCGAYLQNFLSNAIRYTRRGRVAPGLPAPRGRRLSIEVWDSGLRHSSGEARGNIRRIPAAGRIRRCTRNAAWVLAWRSRTGSRGMLGARRCRCARGPDAAASLRSSVPLGDACGGFIDRVPPPPILPMIAWRADACSAWKMNPQSSSESGASRELGMPTPWRCATARSGDGLGSKGSRAGYSVGGLSPRSRRQRLSNWRKRSQKIWGRRVPSIVITADHTQEAQTAATALRRARSCANQSSQPRCAAVMNQHASPTSPSLKALLSRRLRPSR